MLRRASRVWPGNGGGVLQCYMMRRSGHWTSRINLQRSWFEREEVINAGDTQFTRADLDSGAITPVDLLRRLEGYGARIVFIAFNEAKHMRMLFEASYDNGLLHGEGYAWLSSFMSEDVLTNDDLTVSLSAIKGADGLLWLKEGVDLTAATRTQYLAKYAQTASMAACTPSNMPRAPDATGYCDTDGTGYSDTGGTGYSAQYIDAVLTYAVAADAIYRKGPIDPNELYSYIRQNVTGWGLGFSGQIILNTSSADRLGACDIQNLQLVQAGRRLGEGGQHGRQAAVAATTVEARFETVGRYSSENGLLFSGTILFPGGKDNHPSDSPPPPPNAAPPETTVRGCHDFYYWRADSDLRCLRLIQSSQTGKEAQIKAQIKEQMKQLKDLRTKTTRRW